MLDLLATAIGCFVILVTALPFSRARAWWVRIWDFPRVQIAALAALALLIGLDGLWHPWPRALFATLLVGSLAFQLVRVWRYTPVAPREVQDAELSTPERRLAFVISNVLQDNTEYELLRRTVTDADADVILCVETDATWKEQLRPLELSHPYTVLCPLSNTYGMLVYSRLPLEERQVEYLVEEDVPSIHAVVTLRDGSRVSLHCLHPRPPAPGESDESLERDAELLLVGQRVRDSTMPVVVCGDLNDVAWSRTTRLFQRVSGLLDPRKGRGMYATFHARWPGLRYPLDHLFHSADFRLVRLERLRYVGSDHFPVCITLSLEPTAEQGQEAPRAHPEHLRESRDTVQEASSEAGT